MHRVELKEGIPNLQAFGFGMFLMHRVELKARRDYKSHPKSQVPNAPCGVESLCFGVDLLILVLFLMYRVELKDQRQHARHR